MKNKIRVMMSAIWYPLAMATYIRQAFERRDDIELITVGPFTGSWIPWNGGMQIHPKYVYTPTVALPQNMVGRTIPFSICREITHLEKAPDLFIQVDAGFHFLDRPVGKKVIHIQTDPHCLKLSYELPKSYSDFNFCMQKAYMEEGEYYLPYAYDERTFFPTWDAIKNYDACLIGLHYENRDRLVNALRDKGMNVHYSIGEIFDQYRMYYSQSKIALNWSSLDDLNARVFEGIGLPVLTNIVSDMKEFFEDGTHYVGFQHTGEAVEKAIELLANPDKRNEIGRNAHELVLSKHTWSHRVQQILETAGLA
jgi:hypothetical protein